MSSAKPGTTNRYSKMGPTQGDAFGPVGHAPLAPEAAALTIPSTIRSIAPTIKSAAPSVSATRRAYRGGGGSMGSS